MEQFKKSSVRFGSITLALAFVANFFPPLYLWIFHGVFPDRMTQLLMLLVAAYIVNWIVQPISYFGVFGTAGTYMAWLTGSVGDIRAPSIRMAQQISEYEAGTDEGEVMTTIATSCSTFVSMPTLAVFVFIGAGVLGLLPDVVKDSFVFILPAMYGAVYIDTMQSDFKVGLLTLIAGAFFRVALPQMGIPSAVVCLFCVLAGILNAHLIYKSNEKKAKGE